ncbi:uncharacterized protein [Rutidosis leptorrhynchoides]|uniref:uncharacterized protein n=1 Tax=Rutidosis leptorrhynchoides TaxID=125765 RepID=UPI003A99C8CC
MTVELSEVFLYCQSAYELWKEIAQRYGQSNGPLLYQLKKELNSISQGNLLIASYFNKMKKYWDELHSLIGVPAYDCGKMRECTCGIAEKILAIENSDKLMQFLMNLNDDYESVRSQIISMDPLPTVNKAYYIVQQVEKQKQVTTHVAEPTAFFASNNRSFTANKKVYPDKRTNNKGDKSYCTFCSEEGHLEEQCFEKVGYLDWYKGKRNKKKPARLAAQVNFDQYMSKDTPFDIAYENEVNNERKGELDQRLVAAVCQEMMKLFQGKGVAENTPGMNHAEGTNENNGGMVNGMEKLIGNNYKYWKMCMEAFFQGHDLWELVTGGDAIIPVETLENVESRRKWKRRTSRKVLLAKKKKKSKLVTKVTMRRNHLHVTSAGRLVIKRYYRSKVTKANVACSSNDDDEVKWEQCFTIDTVVKKNQWIVDSGCSHHVTGDGTLLHDVKDHNQNRVVITADNSTHQVKKEGCYSNVIIDVNIDTFTLEDVYLVPKLTKNLVSKGSLFVLSAGEAYVKKTSQTDNGAIWHARLGHGCQYGKSHRLPYKKSTNRKQGLLDLIHTDLMGPTRTPSYSGHCYIMVLIDDHSRFTWVKLLKEKREALSKFIEFKEAVESKFERKVKALRSDNGGEFMSNDFFTYCKTNSISRQMTCPNTPQQNGVSERKIAYRVSICLSWLHDKGLPRELWAEALQYACHASNQLPSWPGTQKSSFGLAYGEKPNVSYFRVFGSICYVHVPKANRTKLDPKAQKCIFVGYDSYKKG